MIANLHAQRASFDSLATMLDADRSIRFMNGYAKWVDTSGLPPTNRTSDSTQARIAPARLKTYARLLHRVGVGSNVDPSPSGVLFVQWAQGSFSQKAWSRGYYYARTALPTGSEVITADLSADSTYGRPPWPTRSLYRHVDGRWYLYSLRRSPG